MKGSVEVYLQLSLQAQSSLPVILSPWCRSRNLELFLYSFHIWAQLVGL